MKKFAVTFKWVAMAIVSMAGDDAEEVKQNLLQVFPNIEILEIQEKRSIHEN